jgi:hypothetical protein
MELSGQLYALIALTPGKEPPVTIGWRLDGLREGLDAVVKRKILSRCRELVVVVVVVVVVTTTTFHKTSIQYY